MELKARKNISNSNYPTSDDYQTNRRSFLKSMFSTIGSSIALPLLLTGCSKRTRTALSNDKQPRAQYVLRFPGMVSGPLSYKLNYKIDFALGKRYFDEGKYVHARVVWHQLLRCHRDKLTESQIKNLEEYISKADEEYYANPEKYISIPE